MAEVFIFYQTPLLADALMSFLGQQDDYLVSGRSRLGDSLGSGISALSRASLIIFESDTTASDEFVNGLCEISEMNRLAKILLISNIGRDSHVNDVLHSNVHGFLLKSCTNKELLLNVVAKVMAGNRYYCAAVTEKLLNEYDDNLATESDNHILSHREIEILAQLAQEMNTRQIARKLYLSTSTVKTHRRNIMRKLEVSNLLSLLRKSVELGILSPQDMPLCKHCNTQAANSTVACYVDLSDKQMVS